MSHQHGISLDDLAWIQYDQFVDYLTLARSLDVPADWDRFRLDVLDALTAAFGLETDTTRSTRHLVVIDEARADCDPALQWQGFADALWRRRHAIRTDLA